MNFKTFLISLALSAVAIPNSFAQVPPSSMPGNDAVKKMMQNQQKAMEKAIAESQKRFKALEEQHQAEMKKLERLHEEEAKKMQNQLNTK